MCFGGSSNRDEAVIIKNRVRPRPSYEEKIYISEPSRPRRSSRYERERHEQDLTLIRNRRDDRRREDDYYEVPVRRSYEPSVQRSSSRVVREEESRRVSRRSYHS